MTVNDNSMVELNAGNSLHVPHTLTIASGGTMTVNQAAFEVGGVAVAGTLNFESGTYGLGNVSNNGNSEYFSLTGTVGVGQANLSLIDADGADLGSSTTLAGGTLGSLTGFVLDGDDDISGYGQLFGHLALGTNVTVAGSGTGLTVYGDVSGTGSVSDTTICGNIDVGNSVGQLTLTDVVIGSDNTMVSVEIGGTDPSLYDTITVAGDTTLAGSLEVELIDSFLPQVGDTFSLFSLEPDISLQGDFNDILLPDLATGLWDASGLLTRGNLLVISATPEPCTFGGDASCNTDDLDAFHKVFNTSVPPTEAQFDLNSDNVVGAADLTEWLSQAATANDHGSPCLRGDTELDRDVDITDFNALASHFDPAGDGEPYNGPFWDEGNFDGDGDTDITDFNLLAANFSPTGYATSAIPEPSSVVLLLLGLGCVMFFCCSGPWR